MPASEELEERTCIIHDGHTIWDGQKWVSMISWGYAEWLAKYGNEGKKRP